MSKNETQWSDDEDIAPQPDRGMPVDDEEESDYDYMAIVRLASKNNIYEDPIIKSKTKTKTKSMTKTPQKQKNIIDIKNIEEIKQRQFNPRLPPPGRKNKLHDKNNSFNLDTKEFPSL